jgi:hypothetical protein
MATQVQLRRGTAAQNDAFTGAVGEVTYDSDNDTLRVHDGGAAGGYKLARLDGQLSFSTLDVTGNLTVDTDTLFVDAANNRVGVGTTSVSGILSVDGSMYAGPGSVSGVAYGFYPASTYGNTGMFSPAANTVAFATTGGERVRIDSSGNVGIGTSSPAVKLTSQLASSGVSGIAATAAALFENSGNSDVVIAAGTTSKSRIAFADSGDWIVGRIDYDHSDNSMRFGTNGTAERMRIDSSGNVGIGTSSPSNFGGANLQVQNSTIASVLWTDGTRTGQLLASASAEVSIGSRSNHPLRFGTNDTERARINTSGNLLVGTTTGIGPRLEAYAAALQHGILGQAQSYDWFPLLAHNTATSNDNSFVSFGTEASYTQRGSISYNRAGGLVAYNTTSDYRAKNIAGPIEDASSTVLSLKPYMGTMKDATTERPMFVAHETQEVAPYAVTGEKDAVDKDGNPKYQQMDHSALVPLLTAALQEALTEIADLKARVAALEA